MLKNVTNYHHPGSLDEALALDDRESRSFFISGGTALALSNSKRPVELIDVNGLGLDGIEADTSSGKIKIGATEKIQNIVESQTVRSMLGGYLSESLEKIGSYPIRNAGTLGGSLVRPFPWSDVIPILSVLNPRVAYYDGEEKGKRRLAELYKTEFRSKLNESIILGVEIEIPRTGVTLAKFSKFARSEFDVAGLNFACRLTTDGGEITEARLSVGARPMTATRAREVEEMLVGSELEEGTAKKAAELAATSIELKGDRKLSGEYRKTLVKKMTEEAIEEIKREVGNES